MGGDRRVARSASAQSVRAHGAHERPDVRRAFAATREATTIDGGSAAEWTSRPITVSPTTRSISIGRATTRSRRSATTSTRRYKRWCDEYFYLKHRKEPRGIGGIFFDDLADGGFDRCFALTRSVGDRFLDAYLPIVARRKETPYGERERDFQAYRRGRYVEFNLVWDRGTLFGLQSNGRTEAILMSLPPVVKWRYDWAPAAGTPEAQLYSDFLIAKDWLE